MKYKYYIISLILLLSSCNKNDNPLKGKWLKSDFTSFETITFLDSLFTESYVGIIDSLPYYVKNDSLFLQSYFSEEPIKINYRITGDTLFTYAPKNEFHNEIKFKYYRTTSSSYFEDIKLHLGLDISLPKGNSNILSANQIGNSIYLPNQEGNTNQHKIFLNNEQVVLDSLLHEKLYSLRVQDKYIHNIFIAFYIDSKIEYKAVRLLKDELRKSGIFKVLFISDLSNKEYYESCAGIKLKLPPIFDYSKYYINADIRRVIDEKSPPKPPKEFYEKPDYNRPNVCEINIVKNQVYYNDEMYDSDIFYSKIKNNDTLFTYINIDRESSYQSYYSFISEFDSLRNKNRNEKSIEIYRQKYTDLTDKVKIDSIRSITTSRLIEY
jgi:biopolymer transport protein ExbD